MAPFWNCVFISGEEATQCGRDSEDREKAGRRELDDSATRCSAVTNDGWACRGIRCDILKRVSACAKRVVVSIAQHAARVFLSTARAVGCINTHNAISVCNVVG